jgi:hypothetical protein
MGPWEIFLNTAQRLHWCTATAGAQESGKPWPNRERLDYYRGYGNNLAGHGAYALHNGRPVPLRMIGCEPQNRQIDDAGTETAAVRPIELGAATYSTKWWHTLQLVMACS